MKTEITQINLPSIFSQDEGTKVCTKKDNKNQIVFDPEKLKGHIKGLRSEENALRNGKEPKRNNFPIDIFPATIQAIIAETNKTLNFPIDFIGSSLLFAASVAIGNSSRVRFKNGFDQPAVLYLTLVGPPGTNKSHPLNWALLPLQNIDSENYSKYELEMQIYEQAKSNPDSETESKPHWAQTIIKDFTPEALTAAHQRNKRGLGVHADELAGWLGNFQRYNKGSEQEFWLSAWNGSNLSFIRKTSDPVYLSLPFISVAGTIQPGVLDRMAEGRTENGFMDRFIFSVPDGLKMEPLNDKDLNSEVFDAWDRIINQILDIPMNEEPRVLELSQDARRLFLSWNQIKTKEANESEDEVLSGIFSKMVLYCLRFALIMELLNYATGKSEGQNIGAKSMDAAIQLTEHFTCNAIKINSMVLDPDPLENLSVKKRELYNLLPPNFTTKEGKEIAGKLDFPGRTFERFLANKKLFSKISRGNYEKI